MAELVVIISAASTALTGTGRTDTSAMASARIPPIPTITVVPNCGSVDSPAMSSRFRREHRGHEQIDRCLLASVARPSRSDDAAPTAAASPKVSSRTRPRSVLWAMASPLSFTTTGKPSSAAAVAAESASGTIRSGANGRLAGGEERLGGGLAQGACGRWRARLPTRPGLPGIRAVR